MTKIFCHLAPRRNVPPPRDRHKASSEVATRRLMHAAFHIASAKGQMKNKCEQSSTVPMHSGHSMGEFRTMRCRRDLVIRRRRRWSQANILIFRGRSRFHTKRHRCKRRGSSKSSWSQRSRYAARAMKQGPFHTHTSWAVSDGHWSARSSYRLSNSATCWSGNVVGKPGT